MGRVKTTRSPDEDIRVWEDKREIKNLMGKYANLLILNRDDEIYDMLWSKSRADTAFGVNEGWYAGADSVKRRYQARYEKNRVIASMLEGRFPDRFSGKRGDALYGIGVFRSMPVSCPIIKVAADGRTAKGLWVCQGSAADLYPYGPAARWIWGYYDVVFVREEGGWKIWRLKWFEELSARCGTDWGRIEEAPADLPEFAGIRDLAEPALDIEETLYPAWSPSRPLCSAKIPGDYDTYLADEDAALPQSLRIDDGEIVGLAPAPASAGDEELSEDDIRKLARVMDKE
ncbi:MAG: nuclear transport factor 2 family protein, partial [Clostridiales Family XIII bacterium]|nr:nuclear transport factor 2 family protein [Clostridiales Family XIII bacterium]